MATIPLLPDESPLVTQALRRVLAAIKQGPAKTTKAATTTTAAPSPTATSAWQDFKVPGDNLWTIHRQPQARLEGGRVVRMRGRIEMTVRPFNNVGWVVGTLAENYRPTTDLVFLQLGGGALEVISATGEVKILASPVETVTFDQVVIPL